MSLFYAFMMELLLYQELEFHMNSLTPGNFKERIKLQIVCKYFCNMVIMIERRVRNYRQFLNFRKSLFLLRFQILALSFSRFLMKIEPYRYSRNQHLYFFEGCNLQAQRFLIILERCYSWR